VTVSVPFQECRLFPPPPRDPIGKRQRFRILTRDDYRCRYCGHGPPEVKVHVDHVLAVALGGKTVDDNLVAACFDCNIGKSASRLPGPVPRRRADPEAPEPPEPVVSHYDAALAAAWLRSHGWDVGPSRARLGAYSIPSPLNSRWVGWSGGKYPLHDIACFENLCATEMARRMTIDLSRPPNPYR